MSAIETSINISMIIIITSTTIIRIELHYDPVAFPSSPSHHHHHHPHRTWEDGAGAPRSLPLRAAL
jgi:hypothetical protein